MEFIQVLFALANAFVVGFAAYMLTDIWQITRANQKASTKRDDDDS